MESLVSVSGVRGIVGESFTEELMRKWAAGFGLLLDRKQRTAGSRIVVIGRDTRPSGEWALRLAAETLLRAGIQPIVLGIVPTPTVQLAVTHHRAAGGIIITASHNPSEWNGLKFLGSDGVFLSAEEMEKLRQNVIASERSNPRDPSRQLQDDPAGRIASAALQSRNDGTNDDAAIQRHIENVLVLPIDVERIRAREFRVVLDPVNGTGGLAVSPLLERFGCTVIVINGEPNGEFSHPPEPTPANLQELGTAVREHRADLGIAVDPDADRLVLVDETGTVLSEECTVTLAVLAVLSSPNTPACPAGRQHPTSNTRTVVVNLSTTRMVDDVARQFGARVIRTPVGERHVVEGMRQHGALIGGEGNGGVIFPKSHEGRDSLVGIALILDLLARRETTLARLAEELPRYAMTKEKLPRGSNGFETPQLSVALRRAFPDAQMTTLDGIRVDTTDGWVHLRPSNTEPVVRLIAEARTETVLERLCAAVRQTFSAQA
ncbi:MAG: phosphoglucosamine mutase [bacterium]|nr:phosphoglucosamine mutase [bacterium]